MLKNAGETESKGVEFSMRMAPLKGFEANVSYGYTHATFLTYMANKTTDYSGNFIPYVPEQTISASGSKTFHFKQGLIESMQINLSYRGTGKYYWTEKNTDYQAYYGLWDGEGHFYKRKFAI